MAKTKTKRKYIKLSIPLADKNVIDWFEAQDDMSSSVRLLIRNDIEKNGVSDVLCRDVTPSGKKPRSVTEESSGKNSMNEDVSAEFVEPEHSKNSSSGMINNVVLDEDGYVDPESILGLK